MIQCQLWLELDGNNNMPDIPTTRDMINLLRLNDAASVPDMDS